MSLLQRLNERAQALQGDQLGDAALKDERKRRFNEETVPALKELEQFLRTLNQQLRALKPNLKQKFDVAGYGTFEAIPSFDWVFVPGESRLNEFTLEVRFKSRVDTENSTKLVLTSYDRVRSLSETFKRLHLGGIREDKRGPTGLIVQATAQATGFVNSKLTIRAHVDEDVVHFGFENVDQLAEVKRQLGAEFLAQEVFDRLGEFMLRENDLFVREQWVRGLQAVVRAPSMSQKKVEAVSLKPVIADELPKPVAPTSDMISTAKAIEEDAKERELDFLAELKFAARYADSVVKKTVDEGDDTGFGQERDLASLRSAFQKQSKPK
jgi:hypothetical protein